MACAIAPAKSETSDRTQPKPRAFLAPEMAASPTWYVTSCNSIGRHPSSTLHVDKSLEVGDRSSAYPPIPFTRSSGETAFSQRTSAMAQPPSQHISQTNSYASSFHDSKSSGRKVFPLDDAIGSHAKLLAAQRSARRRQALVSATIPLRRGPTGSKGVTTSGFYADRSQLQRNQQH